MFEHIHLFRNAIDCNCIWFRYAKSSTRWKKLVMFSKDMAVIIYNHPSLPYHIIHTADFMVLVFHPQLCHIHSPLYSGHFCFSHLSLQTESQKLGSMVFYTAPATGSVQLERRGRWNSWPVTQASLNSSPATSTIQNTQQPIHRIHWSGGGGGLAN